MSVDYGGEYRGPWATYGDDALFRRICPVCARYVTPDPSVWFGWLDEMPKLDEPNATCRRHGRVTMPFEGWAGDFETAT